MIYFKTLVVSVIGGLSLATLGACSDTTTQSGSTNTSNAADNLLTGALTDTFHADGEVYFTLANGELTTKPDGGRFKLRTLKSYGDFALSIDFFVEEETNSGLYIRCENPEDINPGTCYEINIFEKQRDGSNGTGSIFRLTDAMVDVPTAGKWNTLTIDAKGDHMVVKVNGQTTVDVHDSKLSAGLIAIQYAEGGKTLRMKNFTVTPL